MSTFKLPDLGEGLPDAEINEWHVAVGDDVEVDQPLVSMETAKAVVEVPSPATGTIHKLHGQVGDIIKTGSPLVEFSGTREQENNDAGTVVGKIESSGETLKENFRIGAHGDKKLKAGKATPAVRAYANALRIDLSTIEGSGKEGLITRADIEKAASNKGQSSESPLDDSFEVLRGSRRSMSSIMSRADQEVVRVTLFDDADIHAWAKDTDITSRIIRAIVHASREAPSLNAWFDSAHQALRQHTEVNLGLAIDTGEDLIVPVIKNCHTLSSDALRKEIDALKKTAIERSFTPEQLQGATISLSNFGNFAGKYANPIIVPPMVAIVGVGRYRDEAVAFQGNAAVHRVLPISLSFDHRCVTGGEASRFLGCLLEDLMAE